MGPIIAALKSGSPPPVSSTPRESRRQLSGAGTAARSGSHPKAGDVPDTAVARVPFARDLNRVLFAGPPDRRSVAPAGEAERRIARRAYQSQLLLADRAEQNDGVCRITHGDDAVSSASNDSSGNANMRSSSMPVAHARQCGIGTRGRGSTVCRKALIRAPTSKIDSVSSSRWR